MELKVSYLCRKTKSVKIKLHDGNDIVESLTSVITTHLRPRITKDLSEHGLITLLFENNGDGDFVMSIKKPDGTTIFSDRPIGIM